MTPKNSEQPRLTDLACEQWEAIQPIIRSAFPPRFGKKTRKKPWTLRDYTNALAYLSVYPKWRSVRMPVSLPPVELIYRFNNRLRERGVLEKIRHILGPGVPFGMDKRSRSLDVHHEKRKCGVCPSCGNNSMRCYKTRRQGSRVARWYRCKECGYRRLWMDAPGEVGWGGVVAARGCE